MRKKNHTTTSHTNQTDPQKGNQPNHHVRLDARNHYPQIKHHTPPPSRATTKPPKLPSPTGQEPRRPAPTTTKKLGGEPAGLLPQDPTVCLVTPTPIPAEPAKHPETRDASNVYCAPTGIPLQETGEYPNHTKSHTVAGVGEPLRYRCSLERR